jgi:hypothetical protein
MIRFSYLRSWCGALALLTLAAQSTLLVTGCQPALTFAEPTAAWQTYQGQLHYSTTIGEGRSIIGEVVVRRAPAGDDFQLQFSSGPGFPLLQLWQSGDSARAEGALARGKWQGRAGSAPVALRRWVQVREVFAQLSPGLAELRGPGWAASATYFAGRPEHVEVAFAGGEERFVFHFSR